MNRDEMYLSLGVSDKVLAFGEAVLEELKPRFAEIEQIAELNQVKVIAAMQENRVNATHFAASTGYGYDDEGRDNLERVYASAFHTEAALVRPQITCARTRWPSRFPPTFCRAMSCSPSPASPTTRSKRSSASAKARARSRSTAFPTRRSTFSPMAALIFLPSSAR